jgi:hypothetical protein
MSDSTVPAIEFKEEDHSYWVSGRRLPSVTQILKRAGIVDTRWYTEEGRARGTAVHRACQLFDEGSLDMRTVDPSIQGYVDGWAEFLTTTPPYPGREKDWQAEVKLANLGMGYAGTADRIAWIRDPKRAKDPRPRLVVIEIKTGQTLPPWTGLQLAAYAQIAQPPGSQMARPLRWAVLLQGDGKFSVKDYSDDLFEDWGVFQAALNVTKWKERNHVDAE